VYGAAYVVSVFFTIRICLIETRPPQSSADGAATS